MTDDKQATLEQRITAVMDADDLDGSMNVCDRYPRLEGRPLTGFERDVRDWGLIYGIAFGMARADAPDAPSETVAEHAYKIARAKFARWAGEIEDPDVVRARAVADVVREWEKAQEAARSEANATNEWNGIKMSAGLHNALSELEQVEVEGTSTERNEAAVAAARAARGGDA